MACNGCGTSRFAYSSDVVKTGIGFGSALAMVVSYTSNLSIGWAIIHGILGWIYVIYHILFKGGVIF